MRRGGWIAGLGAITVIGVIGVASGPACTIQGKCTQTKLNYCQFDHTGADGAPQFVGDAPCQGHLVDDHTWVSADHAGVLLPFRGEADWQMYFVDHETGKTLKGNVVRIESYISATPQGGELTLAGGNLAVYHIWDDPSLKNPNAYVRNDTCADYYVQVWAYSDPTTDPDAAVADAGAD